MVTIGDRLLREVALGGRFDVGALLGESGAENIGVCPSGM